MFAFLKFFLIFFLLYFSGSKIAFFLVPKERTELKFAIGITLGIATHIFLINLIAHFIKGIPCFYLAIILQIIISLIISKTEKVRSRKLPQKVRKVYIIYSIIVWLFFLYLTSNGNVDGADSTMYSTIGSVFARGDYPIHTPWQPNYQIYHHIGIGELLGPIKQITHIPYTFLHAFLALIMFVSLSQLFTWFYLCKKLTQKISLLLFIPSVVASMSLGNIKNAIPTGIGLPKTENILDWLRKLPTFLESFNTYGSPIDFDSLTLFIHRLVSIVMFFVIGVIITSDTNKNYKRKLVVIIILLAASVLVDEMIFIVGFIPIIIVSWFTIFKKRHFKKLLFFVAIISFVISFQGGIVTETFKNLYSKEAPSFLIFPEDSPYKYENYRSFRFSQIQNKTWSDAATYPLTIIHVGLFWTLFICSLITLFTFVSKNFSHIEKYIHLFFLLTALSSGIAFFVIVPKGIYHLNGNRFLTFSFYLAGLSISLFLLSVWPNLKMKLGLIVKLFIASVFVFSLIPTILRAFPRPKHNWYKLSIVYDKPQWKWIRKNIPISEKVLVFTDVVPIPAPSIELAREVGALTPVWDLEPRVYAAFDMGPIAADIFYTLNSKLLKRLDIKYLIINERYFNVLTPERQADLTNPEFFDVVYTLPDSTAVYFEKILRIKDEYFRKSKELTGTFEELKEIAPKEGVYYIGGPPNTPEYIYRATVLTLNGREMYYDPNTAFYNGQIDISYTFWGQKKDKYDYLVLSEGVNPSIICTCNVEEIWKGFGNNLKLLRVKDEEN